MRSDSRVGFTDLGMTTVGMKRRILLCHARVDVEHIGHGCNDFWRRCAAFDLATR